MTVAPAQAVAAGVRVELDVPARMRDGTVLRANVFRPADAGPWPVLLNRTPYGKDRLDAVAWPGIDPLQVARRGFLVVVQDTRGRYASDGVWDPFRDEGADGFDTVEWAARLDGSNGRVGMYGGSYHGNTQWLAAMRRAPALRAVAPLMTWSDPHDGLFSRGGAVELGFALMWALDTGLHALTRNGFDDAELARRLGDAMDELDRLTDGGARELPVAAMAPLTRHGIQDVGALRALDDPALAACSRVDAAAVDVPSFHTGGWYDLFLQGTLDNFVAASAAGRDARLVVGPWTHQRWTDPIGQRPFGVRAGRDGVAAHPHGSWSDFQLAWLRRQLVPEADVALPDAPVRIFVMGRNVWRDEPSWPLPDEVRGRWYLRADGSLTPDGPDPDGAVSAFVHDPEDPVPTVGGHGAIWPGYLTGPMEQAAVEARDDVLVFTSAPLAEDLEVTGRVRVVLHGESSARSTDWVARLCDVDPSGRSFPLCDGIVRVVGGADAPGRHEIDLWSTSNVFLRGHRIRVHVTGSSFPRWDRNLGTGDQGGTALRRARQRVHHGAARPTFVELPVIRPRD